MKQFNNSKYGILQNVLFLIKAAWKVAPSVLWLCLLLILLRTGIAVTQLFLAPAVLSQVETHSSLGHLLGTIGGFTAVLVLGNGALGYLNANTIFGRISVRISIITLINHKTYTTSYPNTRDPKVLKLLEEALNHCNSNQSAAENTWTTLSDLMTNVLGFVIYLFLFAQVSTLLMAAVTAITVAGFFLSSRINEWGYRHREERQEYLKQEGYFCHKAESKKLAKDIRIFGLRPWIEDIYNSVRRAEEAFIIRRERMYTWACVVDVVMQIARNGIAYGYLLHLALTEGLTASQFLLYFTGFTGFSAWVTGIMKEFTTLHKQSLELSVIQEYIALPEQFRFSGGIPIPKAEAYELRLENVTFRYPGTKKDILHNVNLTVRPGEKVAVVGLNGAGKTTLVKLLCGFYDPDEGRVLLNGTDIREFNRGEYYDLFSAVFQDMSVLDVTVREQVAQAVEKIDEEKVRICIEKAGLTRKVESLPEVLESHVGKAVFLDGMEFSGGEIQRLMLARALYKDGPILVLDEPTAALDPIAENDIYQKYNEMTRGKTSLFISHRLASTRFCDRILFLEDGGIAEEGTHSELLKKNGKYAALFEVQARYYQEGADFRGEK